MWGDDMFLDPNQKMIFGLDKILEDIKASGKLGENYKRNIGFFAPFEKQELEEEWDRTESFVRLIIDNPRELRELFLLLSDAVSVKSIVYKALSGDILDIVDVFNIKKFIAICHSVSELIEKLGIRTKGKLREFPKLKAFLEIGGKENSFYVSDDYSEVLKKVRTEIKNIQEELSSLRRERYAYLENLYGVKVKRDGEIIVEFHDREKIKALYLEDGVYVREEGISYIIFKVKKDSLEEELEAKLELLRKKEQEEETEVLKKITEYVSFYAEELLKNENILSYLDWLQAKSQYLLRKKCVRPNIGEGKITIKGGRHPLLEDVLEGMGLSFQPQSIDINKRMVVITGANMGGKTVTLKLIGLFIAMAQAGLFVPAESFSFPMMEFVHYIGDIHGDMKEGLSTFGKEVTEINHVLAHRERKGLLLLDETAKGTNPEEAKVLVEALLNYLYNRSNFTVIIATHLDGIGKNAEHWRVKGLKEEVKEEIIKKLKEEKEGLDLLPRFMDYTLERVEHNEKPPRNALMIAAILGLPEELMDKAYELMEGGNKR